MATADRGERETAARLQKVARMAKRGVNASMFVRGRMLKGLNVKINAK
jgi:hypothetical protein